MLPDVADNLRTHKAEIMLHAVLRGSKLFEPLWAYIISSVATSANRPRYKAETAYPAIICA